MRKHSMVCMGKKTYFFNYLKYSTREKVSPHQAQSIYGVDNIFYPLYDVLALVIYKC